MSTSYESTFDFGTATFDFSKFEQMAKAENIWFEHSQIIFHDNEGHETDFTNIKLGYDSYRAKAVSELVKLIPKPYQVVSSDDLEGEWLSTTTIVE